MMLFHQSRVNANSRYWQRDAELREWHTIYALRPRYCQQDDCWVWLGRVERRRLSGTDVYGHHVLKWEYRLPEEDR